MPFLDLISPIGQAVDAVFVVLIVLEYPFMYPSVGLDTRVRCGIIIITYFSQRRPELPAPRDRKAKILLSEGTLNPAPEKVRDPKFREGEFFDPRDAVQVKYEMLRRVSVENASITDASEEYGVSRPTFYQAKASLEEAGIAGLVPKKRGPRGPHKLQGEVLAFLEGQLVPGQAVRARELSWLIRHKFGFDIHPRTVERAARVKKTPRRAP
jgi:transposase